eukprot:10224824-Lingulodinium_polyedra.AAC.1
MTHCDVRRLLDACAVFLNWEGVSIRSKSQKEATHRLERGAAAMRQPAIEALTARKGVWSEEPTP